MTDLAPVLQGFFTDRLARQKKASPNTITSYRDTSRLLLTFAQDKTGRPPSALSLAVGGGQLSLCRRTTSPLPPGWVRGSARSRCAATGAR